MAEKEKIKKYYGLRISADVGEKLAAAHAKEIGKRGKAFPLSQYADEIILKGLERKK